MKATTDIKAIIMEENTVTEQSGYGVDVIEFNKHCDEELQKLITSKQERYNKGSETLYYKDKAANIHWQCGKPLELAVMDLYEEMAKGYTLVKLSWNPPLDLFAVLRKPEKTIKSELLDVAKQALEEYNQSRYELNVAETQHQLKQVMFQKKRAEEVAAAEAAAQAAAAVKRNEEAEALADLLKAYAAPEAATSGQAA